ncbi:hypothetical protein [Oryza sativa Japonica Group]|uniref:Uncharacterized protein P0443D08.12 n=1 Tax=Oryza sativa subsp. japonica TaxID=39947 RepID=Q5ZC65_ORYSJ|nr:hypothetical protein [Oryza sativa Japonica Group]
MVSHGRPRRAATRAPPLSPGRRAGGRAARSDHHRIRRRHQAAPRRHPALARDAPRPTARRRRALAVARSRSGRGAARFGQRSAGSAATPSCPAVVASGRGGRHRQPNSVLLAPRKGLLQWKASPPPSAAG